MKAIVAIALAASVLSVGYLFSPDEVTPQGTLNTDVLFEQQFMSYLSAHQKSYSNVEEFYTRMSVFRENQEKVNTHNANPNKSFTMGLSKLSDMTQEEIDVMMGFTPKADDTPATFTSKLRDDEEPRFINWMEKGCV